MHFCYLGVFLISVKPLTTVKTEYKTTPKVCKITVIQRNIIQLLSWWLMCSCQIIVWSVWVGVPLSTCACTHMHTPVFFLPKIFCVRGCTKSLCGFGRFGRFFRAEYWCQSSVKNGGFRPCYYKIENFSLGRSPDHQVSSLTQVGTALGKSLHTQTTNTQRLRKKGNKKNRCVHGTRHVHLRPALKSALKIALSLNFQFEQNRA